MYINYISNLNISKFMNHNCESTLSVRSSLKVEFQQ